MTYLLDVNILIALLDQDHVHHDVSQSWFVNEGAASWATCPITENGAIRILGHARYPKGPDSPAVAAELLNGIRNLPGHRFWHDDMSLFDAPHVRLQSIGVAGQVTDTYLLALAVRNGGRLATFERRLSAMAVEGGADALAFID